MLGITDFMPHKNMTLDDLIEQLTEIRESSGNLDVVIPVEIVSDDDSLQAYGLPIRVRVNEDENVAEIELMDYFEV